MNYSNLTETTNATAVYKDPLPVLGYPGINFYILHYVALFSLGVSLISSTTVFFILRPSFPAFWQRSAGERLVIYLAMVDMFYSLSHSVDHSTMLVLEDHPPVTACAVMGSMVAVFIFVQALMVTFMALNAYMLIVREKKISLGKYDWKFLTGSYLPPITFMIVCASMDWLGASGAWCCFDNRKVSGPILYVIMAGCNILVICVNIFSYISIFLKIRKITKATQALGSSTNANQKSRVNTGNTMMKFVAAYILQYITLPPYSIYGFFTTPPWASSFLVVLLLNMGGFYNLIVYTLVRNIGKKGAKYEKNGTKTAKSESDVQTMSESVDKSTG